MGINLIRSPQVRNTLERLVTSGAIKGDKVTAWKKKLEDEKKLKELRAKAEHDPGAMNELGRSHCNGWLGLPKSREQARACYERGAALHHVKCMAHYGDYLTKGGLRWRTYSDARDRLHHTGGGRWLRPSCISTRGGVL